MAKENYWKTFPWVDDLPLFSAANNNRAQEAYELWRAWDNGQDIRELQTDTSQKVIASMNHSEESWAEIQQDVLFDHEIPVWITTPYFKDGEELWEIGVLRIEYHEFYNVAVIEITHKYPWVNYTHIWRKFNPSSWKYDGPVVETPKVSNGRITKKRYRIQYVSWKINEWNYGVFCFWWEVKDGKRADLNLESIVPALKEIESLALQKISLQ